jgi:hypothetical protein
MHATARDPEEIETMLSKSQKMPYLGPSIINSDYQRSAVMADQIDSYEPSPEQERASYEAAANFKGQVAVQKHSKEHLIKTHFSKLELLKNANPATKQLILPIAYSPSTSSLDSLRKV